MRLLAIDDLPDNLVSLTALLRACLPGCETATATSGREGIEKARSFRPDAILLDIQMPEMDGFETCRVLKEDPDTRHVPVIFLTARNDDPASRIRGLGIGGDAFLTKPVDPGELTAQVKAMVRIKQAEDRLREESHALEGMVAERTAELSRRVRHLDAIERITRISLAGGEMEEILGSVLEEMLTLFGADRAWFLTPCDPDAPSWSVPIERTRAEWPGAFVRGTQFPTTPEDRAVFRLSLDSRGPVQIGPFAPLAIPAPLAETFSVRSIAQAAVRLRTGPPWLLGIHHCAEARAHDVDDLVIFDSIAQRVSETLSSLITLKRLRESDERFRTLAEYAPVGIYMTDARRSCTFTNRAWLEMTGLEPEEAAGSGWLAALHPDDRALFEQEGKQPVAEGGGLQGEYRFVAPSGKVTWVEGKEFPLKDGRGTVTGTIGTNVDITERRRIEATQLFLLRCGQDPVGEGFFPSLARFLAEDLQMDFVCIDRLEGDGLNARTVAVWCDGTFQDNVTYALKDTPCGDVVGKAVCCFPASVCQLFPRDEVLLDLRAESYVGVTLWDHAGKPIGLIAVIGRRPLPDRSLAEATLKLVAVRAAGEMERAEAEAALRQSETKYRQLSEHLDQKVRERTAQLEVSNRELEAFSYSVSHDLRAPLRAIEGFSAMVVEHCGPQVDAEVQRLLGVVRTNARRMAQLIDDLLAFSRTGRSEIHRVPLDMEEMARSAFGEVVPEPEERAKIDFRVGELPGADGDAALLRQVWINLLSNAVKFSSGREKPVVKVEGSLDGEHAVFRVRDNGAGFDMAYVGKLFGVFQRLHGMKEFEGTGVGLALVQRIVGRHGGRVWAEGAVGRGATLSFALPAARRDATAT